MPTCFLHHLLADLKMTRGSPNRMQFLLAVPGVLDPGYNLKEVEGIRNTSHPLRNDLASTLSSLLRHLTKIRVHSDVFSSSSGTPTARGFHSIRPFFNNCLS